MDALIAIIIIIAVVLFIGFGIAVLCYKTRGQRGVVVSGPGTSTPAGNISGK